MRSSYKVLFFAPALVLAAACSKDKPADATLSNDLTLAAQARQNATLDSISAAERARAAAPALRTGTRTPARTTSTPRRTSSGTSSSSSSGTVAEQQTVTEENTKSAAALRA